MFMEITNTLSASKRIIGLITATAVSVTLHGTILNEVTTGKLPQGDRGILKRYTAYSPELKGSFTVDILLPDGYDDDGAKRYPVLYMHDGQNLFDPSISYGGVAWEVEQTLGNLIDREIINAPIVVGIHNRESKRPSDYIPAKPATDYIAAADRDASGMWTLVGNNFNGDAYAAFVAKTLKPAVDGMFRTLSDRDNTFIMGSSMGGLASLYAMCEYPDIFGAAACLSTHWIGNFDPKSHIYPTAVLDYMNDHLPDPATHRLYFDRGTVDLDSYYGEWDDKAIALAKDKGYSADGGSLYTFVDDGASHNEAYWAARLDRPLHFLLHSTDEPYEPSVSGETEFHVIFKDSRYSWDAPCAFVWTSGVTQLGTWPGMPMTRIDYDGEPAWSITFRHKIEPSNIIFNDGRKSGGVQTTNLTFSNNYVYNFNGLLSPVYLGITAVEPDGKLKVFADGGGLVIEAAEACTVPLVAVDGRVTVLRADAGINRYGSIASGIYIVAGRKVVIR